ncbi:MAG: hypothetical protein U0Q18_30995 [Bryobacteraceae bacterium]
MDEDTQGDLKKAAFQLADSLITPDEMFNLELRCLLLHEIGYALGLVSVRGKNRRITQDHWRDHGP